MSCYLPALAEEESVTSSQSHSRTLSHDHPFQLYHELKRTDDRQHSGEFMPCTSRAARMAAVARLARVIRSATTNPSTCVLATAPNPGKCQNHMTSKTLREARRSLSCSSSSHWASFPVLSDPAEPWSDDFQANRAAMDKLVDRLDGILEEVRDVRVL